MNEKIPISGPLERKVVFSSQEKQGLIYGIRLLKISKRSEANLKSRLREKGYPHEAIHKITQTLKNQKYLDDQALARDFVYWAARGKSLGRKRIWFELKKRGLPENVIAEALNGYDLRDEKQLAQALALARYQKLNALHPQARRKRVYDFLVRRGFDYETCRDIVTNLESHENG